MDSIIGKMKRFLFPKVSDITVRGAFKTSRLRHEQNIILRQDVATLADIKSILNIGARPDDSDKEGDIYRNYFKGCEFYTLDKTKLDHSPNHFNIDIHDLSKINRRFDLVLIMSSLEHFRDPFMAVKQAKNVLVDKGYLFICAPFFYPIHKEPQYSDYWRFSDDGLRILVGDGVEELWLKSLSSVIKEVEDRQRYWDGPSTVSGYCALFRKLNARL